MFRQALWTRSDASLGPSRWMLKLDPAVVREVYREDSLNINGNLKIDLVERIVLAKDLDCLDMPDYDLLLNEITAFRSDVADMRKEVQHWNVPRKILIFDGPLDPVRSDQSQRKNVQKQSSTNSGVPQSIEPALPSLQSRKRKRAGDSASVSDNTPTQGQQDTFEAFLGVSAIEWQVYNR